MSKIDTSNWGEFKVGDLFEIKRPKARSEKNYSSGIISYVSSGSFNNGVAKLLSPIDNEQLEKGKCITVSPLDGASFWQENDFLGRGGSGASISLLYNNNLNQYNAQFICSIIRRSASSFDYKDLLGGENLKNLTIKLPIDVNGNPDWAYMEKYMANLDVAVSSSLTTLQSAKSQSKKKIETNEWKEFKVGDLFEIHPTKAYKLTNSELLDDGKIPVVVNSSYNNGIGGYSSQNATEKGNIITFSDTVDANTIFYQEKSFIGYSHIQGLYPIGQYKNTWTKYSLQFFISTFRKKALSLGFDYGNKFRRDIAKDLTIKLPIKNGQPNWVYMENYMRNIEQKINNSIDVLVS